MILVFIVIVVVVFFLLWLFFGGHHTDPDYPTWSETMYCIDHGKPKDTKIEDTIKDSTTKIDDKIEDKVTKIDDKSEEIKNVEDSGNDEIEDNIDGNNKVESENTGEFLYVKESVISDSDIVSWAGELNSYEKIVCGTLQEIYGKEFKTVRPNFLKSLVTGKNLEIDCYNHELRIGAEYNGEQHYVWPNWTKQTYPDFIKQVQRDTFKRKVCDKKGIFLITIPYNIKKEDIPQFIRNTIPKSLLPKIN